MNRLLTPGRIVICLLMFFLTVSCAGNDTKLAVGDQAPDFSTHDFTGAAISLAAYKDKPVIMRFYLPDCNYCRSDTLIFNALHEKYKDTGLKIIYVNVLQENYDNEEFAGNYGISFPIIHDKDGRLSALYNIKKVPLTVFLDPGHTITGAILEESAKKNSSN